MIGSARPGPIGTCATPMKFSTLPGSTDGSNEKLPTCSSAVPVRSLTKRRRASAMSRV
jgi:hypothetical protein